ncbi:single-strand binding protein Ssb [Mycobacterium lentiflavum]|uniref:Single-stranded DNA-binding protein n=1 Tax=Mycobacterium lentiflavum TaxID=141349 RepID=A0A0E3WEA5_MYCLN|nr:single-stranded DNA-binding protein [Mycobacterium lentiflavum]CQD24268.1 single-strand binding protein Ssb [Mycobacterium lentiflavum]
MSINTTILVGNVTDSPELRFLPSGKAVANFTVADTPRFQDPTSGEWKDGEALFQRVVAWGDLAENIAETVRKGTRVVIAGRLMQKSFTNNEGTKHNYTEIRAEEVAASLKYATAVITKTSRKTQ